MANGPKLVQTTEHTLINVHHVTSVRFIPEKGEAQFNTAFGFVNVKPPFVESALNAFDPYHANGQGATLFSLFKQAVPNFDQLLADFNSPAQTEEAEQG